VLLPWGGVAIVLALRPCGVVAGLMLPNRRFADIRVVRVHPALAVGSREPAEHRQRSRKLPRKWRSRLQCTIGQREVYRRDEEGSSQQIQYASQLLSRRVRASCEKQKMALPGGQLP
jgi:hypothetical protein